MSRWRGDGPSDWHALVRELASVWPWMPSVEDELAAACRFLDAPDATALLAAANVLGVAVWLVVALAIALSGAVSLLPVALVAGVAPPLAARHAPLAATRLARTRALGEAPALFGRLSLRFRIEPSIERASRFAARSGEGRLAAGLAEHTRRAQGGPEAGLRSFATEWAEWEPAVERAAALVADAADAPRDARERGCERALETVLSGAERRLAAFADDIRAPLTGLYAFGVLLPLALVGVLPAARLAGLPVGIDILVVLYDGVLPLGLLVAGGWLLTRRPVAFPPPRVGQDHPDVPDKRVESALLGLGSGVAAAVVCAFVLPWALEIAAAGVGTGAALAYWFEPRQAVRAKIRETESGLPDALALVGRRVADGTAVERALATVGEELPGPTGALLSDAAERGRRLRLPVHSAFFGRHGVLDDASTRARDAGTMFSLAATEGEPAGDVLVAAGDHLRELQSVEAEARRELAAVTGTLANTAVLFGPIVGGVTVAMVGGIPSGAETAATAGGPGGSSFETAALARAIGVYVLTLAAILTAIATGLERGLDPTLVGYRVGIALPTATGAYVAAVVAAGAVL
ncbi:MAG: type II secretion system protein [Halolamina sp.]